MMDESGPYTPRMTGNSEARTLLVCLGAQKAGTTWLWNYLLTHPQCAVTPLKELHFFTGGENYLKNQLDRVEQEISRASDSSDEKFLREKRSFICDAIEVLGRKQRTVEDYAKLVSSVAKNDTKVIAELTPANCGLSRPRLQELSDHPGAPKFVMILRDPVERLWSQIRMAAKQQQEDPIKAGIHAKDILDGFLNGNIMNFPNRHDYKKMLRNAQAVIPEDRLFVDFFETFINQSHIDEFCSFLGIESFPAQLSEPVLVGINVALPLEDRKRLRDALLDQYLVVEKKLGTLPSEWYETLNL